MDKTNKSNKITKVRKNTKSTKATKRPKDIETIKVKQTPKNKKWKSVTKQSKKSASSNDSTITVHQVVSAEKVIISNSSSSSKSDHDSKYLEEKTELKVSKQDQKAVPESSSEESKSETSEQIISSPNSKTSKTKKRKLKEQDKLDLQIHNNLKRLEKGQLTESQREFLSTDKVINNEVLMKALVFQINLINKRALNKSKKLKKREYIMNKVFFCEWLRTWKPKDRVQKNTANPSKTHHMRISGASKVLSQSVLYDAKEDYSYLLKYIIDKIEYQAEAQNQTKRSKKQKT